MDVNAYTLNIAVRTGFFFKEFPFSFNEIKLTSFSTHLELLCRLYRFMLICVAERGILLLGMIVMGKDAGLLIILSTEFGSSSIVPGRRNTRCCTSSLPSLLHCGFSKFAALPNFNLNIADVYVDLKH